MPRSKRSTVNPTSEFLLQLRAYLDQSVVAHMAEVALGRRWLGDIFRTADGIRLAICLAIDIYHSALDASVVARVLDQVDPSYGNARAAFAEALERFPGGNDFVCGVTAPRANDRDKTYLRIIDLWEFIEYYAGPTYYYTLSVDDESAVYEAFVSEIGNLPLGDIHAQWSGARGRVWVMAQEELEQRVVGMDDDSAATHVNDFLGLGRQPQHPTGRRAELLAVRYPRELDPGCRRPIALDASWKHPGGYYISSDGVDGWGRTQSCSGTVRPCPERVHSAFQGLTNDFTLKRIGRIVALSEDRMALLHEAFSRCPIK